MPRATRFLEEGYVYHLTHRCHDGAFRLRFKKERDVYREWLRVGARRHGVAVLGYAVTSNHTHLIVEVSNRGSVAAMMGLAAGVTAQEWNRRKGHEGSMWEHPYRCTRVQDGQHLLNCLRYVDLNMVRAQKVAHPNQWRWCGYDELTGQRERYRIIDCAALLRLTEFSEISRFVEFYTASIDERIESGVGSRRPHWTDAIAVGDEDFVAAVVAGGVRPAMAAHRMDTGPDKGTWMAQAIPRH